MTDIQAGQTVGSYTIIRYIDQGGMATIYQAHDEAMGRDVAIKVMPREYINDEEFFGRFQQEVRLIANLEHSHILPVYSYGEHEGVPYLVMRYLEGGTLKDIIREGHIPVETIDRIFVQLTYALIHAHKHGVIHRDIKPSNVLIDLYGNVYLTDFGIAKLLNSTTRFTPTGAITGTPTYISPEQAQGETVIDIRTDIYALGVLMYEMFTGHIPHEAETPVAMLLKKVNQDPVSPTVYLPDLPPIVEDVLLKALARNPDERYRSVREYLLEWKAALAESGISTTSYFEEDFTEEERALAINVTAVSHLRTQARRTVRRKTVYISAMLVLFIAFFFIWTQRSLFKVAAPQMTFQENRPSITAVIIGLPTQKDILLETKTVLKHPPLLPLPTAEKPSILPSPLPVGTQKSELQQGTQDSSVQPQRIAGPFYGSLVHKADGKDKIRYAGVNVKNFIARVVFSNPYSTGKGKWDVGFFFRAASDDDGYRLVLSSDNRWILMDQRPSEVARQSFEIASGEITGLDPHTNAKNVVMLIVLDDNGFLLLNNQIITKLNLSMRKGAGDVAVGTGFFPQNQTEGFETHYDNFVVWNAETAYGPSSGMLEHHSEEKIVTRDTNLNLWNFVVMAHFKNPYPPAYAPWSVGYAFRSLKVNDEYRVAALSDSRWVLNDIKNNLKTNVSEGKPANLRLGPDDENELLLFVWESKGTFYVNGSPVARLDLTKRKYPGDVAAATALLDTDQVAGRVTRFSNFTVWALP